MGLIKKEGIIMANRNAMGPRNEGPLTGRGLGNCKSGNNDNSTNRGQGLGRGRGRGFRGNCGRGNGFGNKNINKSDR